MEKLEEQKQQQQQSLKLDALNKYGTDLTQMAREGKLDPIIGRQKEIERITQILCKRKKNNPCLIGDPGVGKTVVVEGLAQEITNSTISPKLQQKKVFSIDMGRLIAGASNRGELEERLMKVVDEVKGSEGRIIVFIDEVHTLVGAGAGSQALDAANILKPPLATGQLKCIGATTVEEYRKYIEKDPALKRRFQVVNVGEPSVDETIEILKGLSHKYEAFHNVSYPFEALVAAARLSYQYISDQFLPDKAIELVDEAGARVHLRQPPGPAETPAVGVTDIEHIVSSITGIPLEKVTNEESLRLLRLDQALHNRLIGQDDAVSAVSRAIRRARVGIRDPTRPIASFLFTGPTGVGKTELAKILSLEYFGSRDSLIRLDMSEFSEQHTVSKLIGSPPGYVGHDDGGKLTEAVRRRPHCLILFDEIEKAHGAVFDSMLQLLDDGRLTDGKGRTVDFKNTIVIMTANVCGVVAEELKRRFRPEFLNRIDEIVVFRELTKTEVKEIAEIMIREVRNRVQKLNIKVKVTEGFTEKMVEEGYNPSYGARPLRRAVARFLEDNLADQILAGDVKSGHTTTADVDSDGQVSLSAG